MAGSQPGESNGGATGSIRPLDGRSMTLPDEAIRFFVDYDIRRVADMFSTLRHLSVMEQREIVKKNLESLRRFPKEEEGEEEEDEEYDDEVDKLDDDEDNDDDDEDDEVNEVEDKKAEGGEILKRQVPNESEQECKKPRLAEGFGCQGEAEAAI